MKNINCNIYQIYFKHRQLSLLENDFIPYDNSNGNATEREFFVFKDCYNKKLHLEADLTGFISWKFKEKTKVSGNQFIEFIQSDPGYDVYFINPFEHENRFESVWKQGLACHPDIIPMVQFIFDEIGYKLDISSIKNNSFTSAYCNFWIGTPRFWNKYMDFCMPIYDYIYNKAPLVFKEKILSALADRVIKATYFPFIFERLFSTLLIADPTIKALKYEYSLKELLKKYNKKTAYLILAARELDNNRQEEAKNIVHQVLKKHYAPY